MAREIQKGDRIVGLGVVRAAAHVDANGVIWDTGMRESHEEIAENASYWRHENGEEIAPPVGKAAEWWVHVGYSRRPPDATSPCIDGEHLALALFRTDPDVMAFCSLVGERHTVERSGGDTTFRTNETAFQRALNIAWDRDENGWRTRAIARAEAVIAEMCK
jgi:hypothetical protein